MAQTVHPAAKALERVRSAEDAVVKVLGRVRAQAYEADVSGATGPAGGGGVARHGSRVVCLAADFLRDVCQEAFRTLGEGGVEALGDADVAEWSARLQLRRRAMPEMRARLLANPWGEGGGGLRAVSPSLIVIYDSVICYIMIFLIRVVPDPIDSILQRA